jgi:hypothetical protein
MRGLDDGPDGLNEVVFNRLLSSKPKVKAKTKRRQPPAQPVAHGNTACVCGHAMEEHGHNDQYPECSECAECVAYEASDP